MMWNPDCDENPCLCPGEERADPPPVKKCAHCGKPFTLTHQRLWPEARVHVTCASSPVVDGVCSHARCCCRAHMAKGATWVPEGCAEVPLGVNPIPPDCGIDHHKPVQHRDRKRPWCNNCGRATDGELIGTPRAFGPRLRRG